MVKLLQDIWILERNGIVIYHRVFDPKIDVQLFGALMSALNTFAEELSDGGLDTFEIKDKRFTIMRKNKLLFVVNADKNIKATKVMGELQKIASQFFNLHPPETFQDWDHDISIFTDFEKEIDHALKDPIKAFWGGF